MIRILRLLPTALASLVLLTACAGQNATIGTANLAASRNDTINKQTFHFTGIVQTFQVPSGVDKITITAQGAGTPSAPGGLVKATIDVNPGDQLSIVVGGAPHGKQGGYNGGADGGACDSGRYGCALHGDGGAGASDVRRGGSELQDRILVAGGAGGQGGPGEFHGGAGGQGGGNAGGRGDNGITVGSRHGPFGRVHGGGGAGGGSQRRGGTRGAAGKAGYIPGNAGSPGISAIGGAGADNYCAICSVSYALLGGGSGGGGGGGYYGGGGGGSGGNNDAYIGYGRTGMGSGGGGGGGSSFVAPSAQNVSIESGQGSGTNGLIVISW